MYMKKLIIAAMCGMLAASAAGCRAKENSSGGEKHPSEGQISGISYKADPSWTVQEEDGQLLLYPEGEQSAASRIVMYYTEADLSEMPAEEVCRETASVLWETGTDTYSADETEISGRKVLKASWSRQKDGTVQNGIGYVTPVKDTGIMIVQYTYDADTENRYGDKTEQFVKNLVIPQ